MSTEDLQDNINDEAEPFKSLAFAMKDQQQQDKNVNQKILRALRNHERRLHRIEKHLHIITRDKETEPLD